MPEPLFNITTAEDELNAGIISDRLRLEFSDNGITLSAKASVTSVTAKAPTWQISDEGEFYIVRKQPAGLNVYAFSCCQCEKPVDISELNKTFYTMFGGTVIYCPSCFEAGV